MSPEQTIIDLLFWIKTLGLTPKWPRRSDRFLNPYTRKIVHYSPKKERLLPHLLWLPSKTRVQERIPALKLEDCCGLTIARVGQEYIGAGPGESEALLSLFQVFRRELASWGT